MMSPAPAPPSKSPIWGPTTKLVIGLTVMGLLFALMFQFRNIIGPLILSFILAYLLHPVAAMLSQKVRISWRSSVNLIYLILVILLLGMFTVTGLAIAQQLQSLIGLVQGFIDNIPSLIADLSTKVYRLGPFVVLDLSKLNLQTIAEQLLSTVQPILGRATSLLSSFATGAAVTLGWGLFVLVISYFLLADGGQFPNPLGMIEIPGYDADIRRLGKDLTHVWNAFLRGQMIIYLLILLLYIVLMTILGVRYAVGIAILAGLAKFVPYAGPAVVWIILALVAFFQNGNYFGLSPLQYTILVVALAVVLDQIFDNLFAPRILGQSLGVHPAAVLVAAIIATDLIGILGLVLAAPVLATLMLLGRYILRKMFDLEPFPEGEQVTRPVSLPWRRGLLWVQSRIRIMQRK